MLAQPDPPSRVSCAVYCKEKVYVYYILVGCMSNRNAQEGPIAVYSGLSPELSRARGLADVMFSSGLWAGIRVDILSHSSVNSRYGPGPQGA